MGIGTQRECFRCFFRCRYHRFPTNRQLFDFPLPTAPRPCGVDHGREVSSAENPYSYQRFSFKAWSKSECSPACFTYCQQLYLSNFWLPGSLIFFFSLPMILKHRLPCGMNGAVRKTFTCDLITCFALNSASRLTRC